MTKKTVDEEVLPIQEDYFEAPPLKLKEKVQRDYFKGEFEVINIAKGRLYLKGKEENGIQILVGEKHKTVKIGDVISL